ncbi:hypothetical protein CYMTET_39123 [Cymbomonas tetramitiformis]|uniref:Uncharacterized protein n=1 Tax=Cymbomonas tetramitiformis TaxID=36881 RepID=A0AAE0F488_9CHLO|nr:hypothetical protein CYMTET_39123 [Cymbomonas tetramitiformis]
MRLDYIDQAQGVGQCRPLNVDHKNVIKSVMAYNPASTQGEVNLLAAYRPPSTRYPDGVPAENMKRDDITTDMLANSDDGTLRWYIFGHQHSFQARSELRSEQPTIEEFQGLMKNELWVGLTPEEMRKLGDEQNTNQMLNLGRDSVQMLSKSLEEGSTVEFKIYDWPAYRAHKELPSHFDLKEELDPGKNYFKFWTFLNYTDQVSVRNTIAVGMQMDKALKNKHQVEWTVALLREQTYALVVQIFELHAKGMLKGMKAFNAAAAAAAEARGDAGPSKRGTKPGTSKRGGRSRSLGKAVAPSLVVGKKGKKDGMSMNLWMSVCGLTNCDVELDFLDHILREELREKQAKEKARQEEEEEEDEDEDEAEEKEKAEDEEVEAEEEDVAEMEVEDDQEPQLLFLPGVPVETTPAEQTQQSQASIITAFRQGLINAMDEADTPQELDAMLDDVEAKADAAAAAGSKDTINTAFRQGISKAMDAAKTADQKKEKKKRHPFSGCGAL